MGAGGERGEVWGSRLSALTCDVYTASAPLEEAEARAGGLQEDLIQAGCKGAAPYT